MKALERLEIRTLSTKGKETLRHRFSNTLRKNFLTSRFKNKGFSAEKCFQKLLQLSAFFRNINLQFS